MALSAVGTGLGQTVVHIRLAKRTGESRNAKAAKRVDQVRASSTIEAWVVRLAVVNVRLAERARKAGGTDALEAVHLVDARAAILALVHGAIVHLVSAVGAIESFRAHAHVAVVRSVDTSGTVQAWVIRARLLSRSLTAASVEASGAVASGVRLTRASPAVETRNDGAVVLDQFTVRSSVFGRAGTGVRSLTSVEASTTVLARLVVGAVVQVLVAEKTTPTFVAVALPRLLARAVQTSRVADALVAQFSLPTQFASMQTKIR